MNPLLAGSTLEGPFRIVVGALHAGAYGALTVAFGLGLFALRRAEFQPTTLRWIRAGFLLLSAGQIAHCTWTTFAWGEFWTWDPGKNLGLLVWLAYAGVLHMHHVPSLKGRKVILGSLVAWAILLTAVIGVKLRSDREPLPYADDGATASQYSTPAGHSGS